MNLNEIDEILNNIKLSIHSLNDSDLFLIKENKIEIEDIEKYINIRK